MCNGSVNHVGPIQNYRGSLSVGKTRTSRGRWVVFGPAGQQPTFRGIATLTEDGYVYVNHRLGPNGEELGKYREVVYRRRD